jgi:hypothetical protein
MNYNFGTFNKGDLNSTRNVDEYASPNFNMSFKDDEIIKIENNEKDDKNLKNEKSSGIKSKFEVHEKNNEDLNINKNTNNPPPVILQNNTTDNIVINENYEMGLKIKPTRKSIDSSKNSEDIAKIVEFVKQEEIKEKNKNDDLLQKRKENLFSKLDKLIDKNQVLINPDKNNIVNITKEKNDAPLKPIINPAPAEIVNSTEFKSGMKIFI